MATIQNVINNIFDNPGAVALKASQNEMDFVNTWTLMSSAMNPAILLATYLMFVLKIGPNYMKDRKPYQLQNIITLYNAMQVGFSVFLVYAFGRMVVTHGIVPKTCALDTEENRQRIAAGLHYYFLAKVSELLDTVFFVLRKKSRQLSFLHIYHHTLMVIVTWTALKYEPSIHLLFPGMLNSFVHVIMYTYYGLSAIPSLTKYLWWKKYITSLQLVQFICILIQFTVAAVKSECAPSYILFAALSLNGFLFMYLFGTFYLNNYTKRNNEIKYKKDAETYECRNGFNSNDVSCKNGIVIKNTMCHKRLLEKDVILVNNTQIYN